MINHLKYKASKLLYTCKLNIRILYRGGCSPGRHIFSEHYRMFAKIGQKAGLKSNMRIEHASVCIRTDSESKSDFVFARGIFSPPSLYIEMMKNTQN